MEEIPMRIDFVTKASPYPLVATLDRLERAARAAGATIFGRIDHQAGAAFVGLTLRPTTVLLFGNPMAGTPLMQEEQTVGLDLPLRVLAWQDGDGQVWLTYRDPTSMARDHAIPGDDPHVLALGSALRKLTDEAIA
jgi:uncharacterized protein (DUF302 family)